MPGSDSSMDDCNPGQPGLPPAGFGSDSSMDDCNQLPTCSSMDGNTVQIPLWTIVTDSGLPVRLPDHRSDSSMDDCNGHHRNSVTQRFNEFRFLYGRL